MQNHFAILGTRSQATDTEVAAAYRQIARRLHPDKNGGVESPEFTAASVAYEAIRTEDQRRSVVDYARLTMSQCGACEGEGHTYRSLSWTEQEATPCKTCGGWGYV